MDNLDRMADKAAHTPVGTGWRNLIHYAPIIKSKNFQRFDYGDKNVDHYGQNSPPEYDMSAIEVPMAIYHGDLDELATPQDVSWLLNDSGLKSSLVRTVEMQHKGHNSFTMGRDMTYVDESVVPQIMAAQE